jgi:hypothetical protein
MRVETARLVIRTFEPRDSDVRITMINDPEVARNTPPDDTVATSELYQEVMERRQAHERERGYALSILRGHKKTRCEDLLMNSCSLAMTSSQPESCRDAAPHVMVMGEKAGGIILSPISSVFRQWIAAFRLGAAGLRKQMGF